MAPSIHDTPSTTMLRTWFAPVLEHGSKWCAPNLDTTLAFVRAGDHELPLTINDEQWDNSWFCSPFTHYISYAQEEIVGAVGKALGLPACLILRALGRWLRRADFNRVVMVNNWLMSTNPWPKMDGHTLAPMIETLRLRWPEHALVFRSLTDGIDQPVIDALRCAGARLIPSRQVWWFDHDSQAVKHATNWKRDVRLLRSSDLDRVTHDDLSGDDFDALAQLYDELYLGKYSRHNPAYSAPWLRHLWQHRLLRFTALRQPGGDLIGVEACGVINGTMVSPVVGYSLRFPMELGLYRRLAAVPVLAAQEARVQLNLSAGVGRFKATRGGQPLMEYIAVLDAHLPASRRAPWQLVEVISREVLAPLTRRWGL